MTNRIEDPDQPEDQTEPTIREVEGGFPHSEILGSKLVRSSPRLIAAYHVLHRLSAPRHPPNALMALDRSHDRCPPGTPRGMPDRAPSERPYSAFERELESALPACRANHGDLSPWAGAPVMLPSSRCHVSASPLHSGESPRSSLIRIGS